MANKSQQANRTIHKTGILPTTGGIRYTSSLKQCVEYQKWDMIWWLFKQNLNKISGIYTSGDLHCILCSPALTGGVIIKAFTALLFFPSGSLFYSRVLSSTVIFVFVFFHSTKTLLTQNWLTAFKQCHNLESFSGFIMNWNSSPKIWMIHLNLRI